MTTQANPPAGRNMMDRQRPTGRGGPLGHGPMGMGMMKGEKPRDFKGTIKKLFQYLGSYKLAILVLFRRV